MALAEATSYNFQVNAISRYIPERSDKDIPVYFFAYWITIKNMGDNPAKLISRFWNITDAHGRINEVKGEGVVGKQPVILPGKEFEYNSFCPLPTEFGFMQGFYEMSREDNSLFKITIPQFRLAAPNSAN